MQGYTHYRYATQLDPTTAQRVATVQHILLTPPTRSASGPMLDAALDVALSGADWRVLVDVEGIVYIAHDVDAVDLDNVDPADYQPITDERDRSMAVAVDLLVYGPGRPTTERDASVATLREWLGNDLTGEENVADLAAEWRRIQKGG